MGLERSSRCAESNSGRWWGSLLDKSCWGASRKVFSGDDDASGACCGAAWSGCSGFSLAWMWSWGTQGESVATDIWRRSRARRRLCRKGMWGRSAIHLGHLYEVRVTVGKHERDPGSGKRLFVSTPTECTQVIFKEASLRDISVNGQRCGGIACNCNNQHAICPDAFSRRGCTSLDRPLLGSWQLRSVSETRLASRHGCGSVGTGRISPVFSCND